MDFEEATQSSRTGAWHSLSRHTGWQELCACHLLQEGPHLPRAVTRVRFRAMRTHRKHTGEGMASAVEPRSCMKVKAMKAPLAKDKAATTESHAASSRV